MRVALYSHSPLLGSGAVHALVSLIERCPHDISCLVVSPEPGDAVDAMKQAGAEVCVLPHYWMCGHAVVSPPGRFLCRYIRNRRRVKQWTSRVFGNLRMRKRHIELLSNWKPDVVYTNTSVIPMGYLAARALGIPHAMYVCEYQTLDHELFPDLGSQYLAWICRHSNVIADSRAVAQFITMKTGVRQPAVVHHGVPVGESRQLEKVAHEKPWQLLMVGKVVRKKGQFEAVEAMKLLNVGSDEVGLVIVGWGELEALSDYVMELGLESIVSIEGATRDVDAYYRRADVYLMCSQHEAFGMCTVEAMMHGLPVIGRDNEYCGTNEIVVHEETGLLYQGGATELAAAIQHMLKHPDQMERYGVAGRERARRMFSEDRYASEIWGYLRGVTAERESVAIEGGS